MFKFIRDQAGSACQKGHFPGYMPLSLLFGRADTWGAGMLKPMPSNDAHAHRLHELVKLRRVRDRIDREFSQPLTVADLAGGVNMSAGHFSRQFRQAYGESPYSYLMTRRIERAMTLLRQGELSVTEVCFEVGCSSLGTFSTRFTELVGVPPSVYRAQTEHVASGLSPCLAKQVTRPVRNREATATVFPENGRHEQIDHLPDLPAPHRP